MKKSFFILMLLTLINFFYQVRGMVPMNGDKKLLVFAIPGIDNKGSSPEYIKKVLGQDHIEVVVIKSPVRGCSDLGQENCQSLLEKQVKFYISDPRKKIIYATSQGSATALNFVAKNKYAINGLILEGVFTHGNRAIMRNVTHLRGHTWVKWLPLSYDWLPYLVKMCGILSYSPKGDQPSRSARTVPDIPIVIIHSKDDTVLLHDNAVTIHEVLKKRGSSAQDNVHLLSMDGNCHYNILADVAQESAGRVVDSCRREKIALLQNILKSHQLLIS